MKLPGSDLPLRTALLYLLFGGMWILLSDQILVLLVPDPAQQAVIQTFKGWFFILVSGSLLYLLLRRELRIRKQSDEIFRLAIESSPNAIIMVDKRGQIVLVNSMTEKYFGYERSELTDENVETLVPARFRGDHANHRDGFFSQPLTRSMGVGRDMYGLRKDGSEFPVEIGLARIVTRQGMLVLATIVDITVRNQVQQALSESEERLRQVWESTSDAMTISDANGIVLAANPACFRLYGYTAGQIIGHSFAVTLPEEAREQIVEQYKAVFSSDFLPPTFETVVRRADGTERGTESTLTFLINAAGRRIAILATVRDITERKLAEQALQEAKDFAEKVIHTANVIFIQLDTAGNIQKFNSAAEEISGYSLAEVVGRNWGETLVPRERYPHAWAEFDRLVKQGETPKGFENPILTRQGEERQILWKSSLLRAENKIAGIISFGIDITERKRAEEKIQLQVRHLSALRDIDLAISASADLRVTLDIFLRQVVSQLKVDAAAILLFQPHLQTLEYAAGHGFRANAMRQAKLKLGEGFAGRAVRDRRTIHTPNFMAAGAKIAQALLLADEGFVDYFGIPLIAKGQVKGVLEIYHRALVAPDPDWLEFLETLAGQGAIAIDNAQLFDGLQRSNTDLTLAYDATIEGWSRALDLRDRETEGHTWRVTEMTIGLARMLGRNEEELVHLRRGALLHDIGKMGVPDGILLKTGPLTDEEWVSMKKHPTHAFEMLSPIHYLHSALDIPYCHHEKWDGTGYPRGLKGEQIPLVARLFAVVDVWDALTSDRPYRPAWTREKALKYIKEESGRHFDPQVVEAFLKLIADK